MITPTTYEEYLSWKDMLQKLSEFDNTLPIFSDEVVSGWEPKFVNGCPCWFNGEFMVIRQKQNVLEFTSRKYNAYVKIDSVSKVNQDKLTSYRTIIKDNDIARVYDSLQEAIKDCK